jgi:DUF438 domain-containing protein
MSEYINNGTRRKETLKDILRQLHAGAPVEQVKSQFALLADEISSEEIAEVEQMLIDEGMPIEQVHNLCDVHVAVMRAALDRQDTPSAIPGHPLHTLDAENNAAALLLDSLQKALDEYSSNLGAAALTELQQNVAQLQEFDRHYLREENLLFPFLEKYDFSGPSQVMWQTHDQVRAGWKNLRKILESAAVSQEKLNLFEQQFLSVEHAMRELFYKEEKILFPTSLKLLKESDWAAISYQEDAIGYFAIQPGDQWVPKIAAAVSANVPPQAASQTSPPEPVTIAPPTEGALPLDVGALTLDQINLLLKNLPVDVTFVDENDRVRYFSQSRERIFRRAPAIIGRRVQQCHPPQSVHRVQQIVDDFRSGTRDEAEFWIQMGGRFIHIRYYAVRNPDGEYRGTLEVSQDVTGIRALQGERRLIDGEIPGK